MTKNPRKRTVRGSTAAVPVPKKFHIDKRAAAIAAAAATGDNDDDLLTTREMAAWLQVSEQWLEIGRHRGYGPKFERLSQKLIRYRRGNAREWLNERSYRSTADYPGENRKPGKAAAEAEAS